MALEPSKLRHTNWTATWKASGGDVVMEGVDATSPDLEFLFHELKVGTTGQQVLGEKFDGLSGTVTVELREIDDVILRKLTPWAGSSGSYSLTPPRGTDMYSYARELVLHPTDLAANVTTEDIHFAKAVPMIMPYEGDGEADNVVNVEFRIYLDRSKLPAFFFGWRGATEPS